MQCIVTWQTSSEYRRLTVPSGRTLNYISFVRKIQIPEIFVSPLVYVESSWNVMAHGDAREGKWGGNWRMEWVASTLHTTSEHGVSSITTADAHTSAASSRLKLRPCRFKWTRPFRRKAKSGFCACAITFQLASTTYLNIALYLIRAASLCVSCGSQNKQRLFPCTTETVFVFVMQKGGIFLRCELMFYILISQLPIIRRAGVKFRRYSMASFVG
jgi:hypothetical protein